MSYNYNRIHWVYPFSRTNKTDKMIQKLTEKNMLPEIQIFDPFISMDIDVAVKYKPEYIDEWYRTSQILLFDNFQNCVKQWMEISTEIRKEIGQIRKNKIIQDFYDNKKLIQQKSENISMQKIENLPDELIHIIWSYVDNETKIKYFIGKYPSNQLYQRLNTLKCPILKKIFQNTCFCYQGYAMKKELLYYHKKISPSSHLNKQEKINEIIKFLTNIEQCYQDEKVITVKSEKGVKIKNIDNNDNPDVENVLEYPYNGTIYPIKVYEKNILKLWLQVMIAYRIFNHN